jgi:hypothetical protein
LQQLIEFQLVDESRVSFWGEGRGKKGKHVEKSLMSFLLLSERVELFTFITSLETFSLSAHPNQPRRYK